MRNGWLALAATVLVVAVATTDAAAAGKIVDSYCSPTGDYCTAIHKKADGTRIFELRTFPKLFGDVNVCVTKRTRVCHSARLNKGPHIWFFHIRWQGNYPKEGFGRYKVRWVLPSGDPLGKALYFRRVRPIA